jgi:hypothetical protein
MLLSALLRRVAVAVSIITLLVLAIPSARADTVGIVFTTTTGFPEFGGVTSTTVARVFSYRSPSRSSTDRGHTEFNLTGLASGSATMTFDVIGIGGVGRIISINAYQGNNQPDFSDFSIPTFMTVGSFATLGLTVGQTLSFDVTSAYNFAIASGFNSLGFRLQEGGISPVTFNNFRLSSTTTVPEPTTMLLFGTGLAGVAAMVRRRRNS